MTYRTDPAVDETGEHVVYERRTTVEEARPVDAGRNDPLAVARRVVGLVFGVMVTLIGLRILLLALGANEGNALVDAIYAMTEPMVAPFRGVLSIDVVRPAGQSILDVAAVVALIGWSLIALLVMAILRLPNARPGD